MTNRSSYTKEFKLEAVRQLEHSSKPISQLALELGVRRNLLYKWQEQLAKVGETAAFQGAGRNAIKDSGAEVAQLKRRIAGLEEENAILKKAAAYFARALP